MQELENLNIAITAIQNDKVKIVNIGSTDINQGNLKIILGLIWTLIQHYHINQLDFLSEDSLTSSQKVINKDKPKENLNAKDKLLKVINEIIKPWGYEAKNFTTDFEDGRILQCLGYTRDPSNIRDPINFGKDNHSNVREALESLDKLGVPRVMDIEDIADKHDEKAMMTLLGYVLKEILGRKQLANGPGQKVEQIVNSKDDKEDDEEILEDTSNVHSSKNTTTSSTQSQNLTDLPKVKRDRHSLFTRFVEIGRVVLITYGEYEGKIAAILDVIDANSVVVAGPTSDVPRHPISLKRVQLTDIIVPFRRNPRSNTLAKAWNQNRIQEQWDNSSWGKKLDSRKRKAEMNDFDRFKSMVAHQQRAKLIRNKRRELVPNKKSKKRKEINSNNL